MLTAAMPGAVPAIPESPTAPLIAAATAAAPGKQDGLPFAGLLSAQQIRRTDAAVTGPGPVGPPPAGSLEQGEAAATPGAECAAAESLALLLAAGPAAPAPEAQAPGPEAAAGSDTGADQAPELARPQFDQAGAESSLQAEPSGVAVAPRAAAGSALASSLVDAAQVAPTAAPVAEVSVAAGAPGAAGAVAAPAADPGKPAAQGQPLTMATPTTADRSAAHAVQAGAPAAPSLRRDGEGGRLRPAGGDAAAAIRYGGAAAIAPATLPGAADGSAARAAATKPAAAELAGETPSATRDAALPAVETAPGPRPQAPAAVLPPYAAKLWRAAATPSPRTPLGADFAAEAQPATGDAVADSPAAGAPAPATSRETAAPAPAAAETVLGRPAQANEAATAQVAADPGAQPAPTAVLHPLKAAEALHHALEAMGQAAAATWRGLGGEGQVPSGGADPAAGTQAAPHPAAAPATSAGARANVAQQIAAGWDPDGEQGLTLQLHPQELGEVQIRFLGRGETLDVQITASTREAESAIRENIQELKDSLGGKAGRFQQVEIKVECKEAADARFDRKEGDQRDQARDQGRSDGRDEQRRQGARSGGGQEPAADAFGRWAEVFREVQ